MGTGVPWQFVEKVKLLYGRFGTFLVTVSTVIKGVQDFPPNTKANARDMVRSHEFN